MKSSSKEDKIKDVEKFFEEKIKGWMLNDLHKAISAETNFLAALGCFVYTEVIGIFLPSINGEYGRRGSRRFYRCLFRLNSEQDLRQMEAFLKKETHKGIYQQFRNNMAHLYFPSAKRLKGGIVQFIPTIVARDGFRFISLLNGEFKVRSGPIVTNSSGSVVICIRNFVNELEKGYDDFYKKIFVDRDEQWIDSALNGFDTLILGK